ncbi:MAG: hypothetical protein M3N95_02560, partial [Actinomycetota bacterium]|nr:hypothetical protein [Actinomycetota bacterium]
MTAATDLDWLELVPAEHIPAGYRDALERQVIAQARTDRVTARIGELDAALATRIADVSLDPLTPTLTDSAEQLAGLREIAGKLPPVPVIPEADHQQIVDAMIRTLHSTPDSPYDLGPPPRFCSELAHHIVAHPRDLPPEPCPGDNLTVELFEKVSAELSIFTSEVRRLSQPLAGYPVAGRVREIAELMGPTYDDLRQTIAAMRVAVQRQDAERITSGVAHRCPQWG